MTMCTTPPDGCNNKKSLDACPFCYTPLSRTRDMQDTGMPTKR
ncbi:transmembrane anchor protein, partial [Escherichia coli]|nr:transmembrane anchor protein [Escherichia coli]